MEQQHIKVIRLQPLQAFVKGCAVEQPMQRRHQRAVGGAIIHRGTDHEPVGSFELHGQFVDDIKSDSVVPYELGSGAGE